MKSFEKAFDGFQYILTSQQKTVAMFFWEKALKHLDEQISDLGLEYGYQVRDYIREELEQ